VSNLSRQLGYLVFLCAIGVFASDASAGYVSFDDGHKLTSSSLESGASMSGAVDSTVPLDQPNENNPHLNLFDVPQLAMQLGPSSSGGMSSVSSSSGGNAPVAMVVAPETLTPSLITPLVIGDEPFSPRMLIAEIFRPPCA
jgi:hypothetical protein